MVNTLTHFALEGLIVWLLLSKKNKSYYNEHTWEFILINLFAVFSDLDILFGYHRTGTHSLIIPVFVLLSMIIAGKFTNEIEGFESASKKLTRFLKLASIMWILHIFLDLSWGPIQLFWPIDTNLYDLTVTLRFENKPWLFLPLSFIGLIPSWTIFSATEGQSIFLTNLSQQEREAIYGQYFDYTIEQITLHIMIFIVWIVIILLPAFIRKNKKKTEKKERKFNHYWRIFWHRLKRQLTLLGLFIVFLGLLLGPFIGRQSIITYDIDAEYRNSMTLFDPTLGITLTHKPLTTTEIIYESQIGLVIYSSSLMLTPNDTFVEFFENFDNLTLNYYDGNITFQHLISEYTNEVDKVKARSYYHTRLVGSENSDGLTIKLNETETETSIYFISVIDEWNTSESFIYDVSCTLNYLINRKQAQIEGGILDGFGVTLIVADQLLITRISKKKKFDEEIPN
jgi:hypothetical protein